MKTVVITGTDRGLGLALAEQILKAGDRAIMTCLDKQGSELRRVAETFPQRATVIAMDIGDPKSVRSAVREIKAHTSTVDRIINNAAILGDIEHAIGDTGFDCEEVLDVLRINTIGPLRVTHGLWELLLAGKEKLLVNISSEAGSIGQNFRDRWYGYCLSKAALNMEGALIHQRLRPLGGRVMQVHPGYVRTFMHGQRNEGATYEPTEAACLVLGAIETRAALPQPERPEYFDLHGKSLAW